MLRAVTREDYLGQINRRGFDVILSDHAIPGFDGLAALELAQQRCPDKPFIFISGTLGEERAIEALHRGAADYIVKDRLGRLISAIKQSLARVEERERRPILALSGFSSPERQRVVEGFGPKVEFLPKPLSSDTLLTTLRRMIDQARSASLG